MRQGRPRETWRQTVEKECARMGLTPSAPAAAAATRKRAKWMQLIFSDPIPHLEKGSTAVNYVEVFADTLMFLSKLRCNTPIHMTILLHFHVHMLH